MNALPFLKPKGWPQLRKMSGESRYGYSEDEELIDKSLDELIAALESNDHSKAVAAIHALVNVIRNKEINHADV